MTYRESIPLRESLIRQVEHANRLAGPWVAVQLAMAIGLAYVIDWHRIAEQPLVAAITAAFIVGPHLMDILRQYVTQKKEINDLKEQTRFGEFDKHRLRVLVNDTLTRLGLPPPGPPVYITADKTLNAGALHLGLGGFFRSLNGVYLNRQVLHRLTAAEIQDIVGHELGHFYRYYLLNQRFQGLTLIVGALGALWVAQWLGLTGIPGMIAISVISSACWYVSGLLYARNGEAIEYLCDDYGAQVNGVAVSINGLLKIGADDELQSAVQEQELSSRRYQNLSTHDVVEAVSAAIPYGHTSREELEAAVAESLKHRSRERRNLSIHGFLEYAWRSDEDTSELDEVLAAGKKLRRIPRLEWESLLDRPGRIALDERRIEKLVEMLRSQPDCVLFHLPSEIGNPQDVHPPLRSRILYLWENRQEIEANGRKGRSR